MLRFGVLFKFLVFFSVLTSLHCGRKGLSKKERRSIASEAALNNITLPRVLLRKYSQLTTSPNTNNSYLYQTIPVTVMPIKDDIYEMTSSYKQANSIMYSTELWMEFPNITRSIEVESTIYYVDITPLIKSESRDLCKHCSPAVLEAQGRFPDDILELKFDITSIYEACRVKDKMEHFKFKVRFFSSHEEMNIDLAKNKVNVFLLFKEKDEIADITQLLPDHVEQLHHENIIRQVPQLKSLKNSRLDVAKKQARRQCQLKHFVFNFEDSGWNDYVIAPKQYQSNNCRGRCSIPIPDHLNATTYTIIKAVASAMDKSMKNPCCVAKDLDPLTMLVHDEDNKIILTVQKEMIAKSCRCA